MDSNTTEHIEGGIPEYKSMDTGPPTRVDDDAGGDVSPLTLPPSMLAPDDSPEQDQQDNSSLRRKHSSVWFKAAEKIATPPADEVGFLDDIMNELSRGAPTDGAPEASVPVAEASVPVAEASTTRSQSITTLQRQRNEYYEQAFAIRESQNRAYNTARARVSHDVLTIVNIRTNITVSDAEASMMDIVNRMATIFLRPLDTIVVNLEQNIPMIFHGTGEPTYRVTVTTLQNQLGQMTNKRHSILIMDALSEALRIPESRGIVQFEGINEDNLAYDGSTVREEINQLTKLTSPDGRSIASIRSIMTRGMSRNKKSNASRKSANSANQHSPVDAEVMAAMSSISIRAENGSPPATATPTLAIRHSRSIPLEHARLSTTLELPESAYGAGGIAPPTPGDLRFPAVCECENAEERHRCHPPPRATKKKSGIALRAYKSIRKMMVNV